MAGTTGLEPATSAVTVSQNLVTYRNAGQWMAPIRPKRNTEEPLLWSYCALDFGPKSARDLCRPAALVALLDRFLCPVRAEVILMIAFGRGNADLFIDADPWHQL